MAGTTKIGIQAVLAKLNDTWDMQNSCEKTYGLQYYKAGGIKGEKYNVRKNVREPKQQGVIKENRQGRSNKKMAGVVSIVDTDTDQIRDIKVGQMVGFRDYGSSNWKRIWH
jgi:hypothetical protein